MAKKNLDLCSCLSPGLHPGKCCQRTVPVTTGRGDPDPSCAQGAEPRAGTWPSQVTDLPSCKREMQFWRQGGRGEAPYRATGAQKGTGPDQRGRAAWATSEAWF